MKSLVPTRPRASWLIPAWFALLFISEFRFEHRSVLASAQGVTSTRVILEFSIYCLVGLIAGTYLVRAGWASSRSTGLDLLFAYGLIAMISAAWSLAPLFSAVRGSQVVALGLLAKASTALWAAEKRSLQVDWRRIWLVYVALISMLGVWGFIVPDTRDDRFAWQGMHPVLVGALLGVSVVACTFLLMDSKYGSRTTRGLLRIAWIWCLWLLILTVTRSALAATSVSLLGLLVVYGKHGSPKQRALLFFATGSASALLWWFAPVITAYVLRGQTTEEFATLTGRVELWDYAGDQFWNAPILGQGFGSGRVLLTEAFPWGGTGHNLWVEAGLGLGLLGIILVSAIAGWILRRCWLLVRYRLSVVAVGSFSVGLLIVIRSIGAETFSVPGAEMTMIGLVLAAASAEQSIALRQMRTSMWEVSPEVLAGRQSDPKQEEVPT